MISEQQLVEKWRKLPPTQQQQVLQFVELLEAENSELNAIDSKRLPTIEIWSPYESYAAAHDLLKLLESDPGEEFV
jgi:hypothetical protein